MWLNVMRRGAKVARVPNVTGRTYYVITTFFYCDSKGVKSVVRNMWERLHVTSFRLRFNNHKSSMMRYGKGQRGMGRQKLHTHFYMEGHVNRPNERKIFWIEKLNTYCPRGLNLREED